MRNPDHTYLTELKVPSMQVVRATALRSKLCNRLFASSKRLTVFLLSARMLTVRLSSEIAIDASFLSPDTQPKRRLQPHLLRALCPAQCGTSPVTPYRGFDVHRTVSPRISVMATVM